MQKYTWKKKVVFIFILVIASLLVALTVGEICIRLFSSSGYVTPEIRKNKSLQYAPALFCRHVFSQKELTADGWTKAQWRINEKGYRGGNFSVAKPKGAIRILFYGGSAVFDPYASWQEDWPRRVENILHQNGLTHVEVINAGIPGHASFDSFGRLFAEGHIFGPDYVVLYNAWNDIKYFRATEPLLRHFRPYVEWADPRLNYTGTLDRFICEHSQLYVYLRHRYYNWRHQIALEGGKPQGQYSSQLSDLALKQYSINVEMFVDLARNIGAVPILMTQARLPAPDNTEAEKKRISYDYQLLTHPALCRAFEKIDQIIHRVAQEKNVFVIDASTNLSGKNEFFNDAVHLTDEGARQLATITAQHFVQFIKKDPRPPN